MSESVLTVVAEMKAKPGKEAALRQVLRGLVGPTRKEEGCLNYDLHESSDHPGTFLFYENWTSKARLDLHLQSAHLKSFLAREHELLDGVIKLSLWKPEKGIE